jgi:ubiquinone/menaquinone biosynthesis C-methylase UbiE
MASDAKTQRHNDSIDPIDAMKEHYSYRVYADPEVARSFDRDRFGGAIGELVKHTQEQLVFSHLPSVKGWKVADIGAGTGRFTLPFLESGAEVTACDASEHMLQVLKEKTQNSNLQSFVIDAHQLQFPDRNFDCVLSFRLLMHVIDWKKALSEICRISRDRIVFDVPPRRGFLILAPLWHRLRKLFDKNVQTYRTFPMREVVQILQKNGYEVVAVDSGFFLPLVVHRLIGSAGFTTSIEKVFARIGLTRVAGSPCTVFARRKK